MLVVASCGSSRNTAAPSATPVPPAWTARAAPAWPYCPRREPVGKPAEAVVSGISFRPCPGMALLNGVLEEGCGDKGRGDVTTFECEPTLEVFDKSDVLVASARLGPITVAQNDVEGVMSSFELELGKVELADGIELLSVTRINSDHMMTLSSTDLTYYAVGDDGTLTAIFVVRIAETVMDEQTGDRVEKRAHVTLEKAAEGVPDIVVERDGPNAERVRYRFNGNLYEVQGASEAQAPAVPPPLGTEGAALRITR